MAITNITNKGFINFNEKYNKKTENIMEASMSMYNGKDESGEAKYTHIKVKAFKNMIPTLEKNIGKLCEIKGNLRINESNGKKYPEILISEFVGENNNQKIEDEFGNFKNAQTFEINEDDLPF